MIAGAVDISSKYQPFRWSLGPRPEEQHRWPAKQNAEKDYDDIPGTYVFDADRSRRGYHLNMFCMSLMKAENRKAFKDNEAKYLDERFRSSRPSSARRSSSASTTGCWNSAATSISPPSSAPPTAIRSSISPR